ncbi:MAG: phosphoglycerate kinase [Hyphomicrobiaceae bacterium]
MDLAHLKSIKDVDVAGKRVLIRVDLNVPLHESVVTDATRIERILPALTDLSDRGARVIVLSHFGRPKGKVVAEFSLKPIAQNMNLMIEGGVGFVDDCIGPLAEKAAQQMHDGDVVIFENVRFHVGEEANDDAFAKALAANGEIFVNEAFSSSHRAHASTDAITRLLPSYAGPLMMAEITALQAALGDPERPTVALVGGAKVSTKISVLTNLMDKVDKLIIGGGMANTFLQAQGIDVGTSLAEPDFHETAREIMSLAAAKNCELLLPKDVVVATEFKAGAKAETVDVDNVPSGSMILDVGPASIEHLAHVLSQCRTLLWNGPMGAFEIDPFGAGTFALANEAAKLTREGKLTSIAGGGDTVAALNQAGVSEDFSYISTAGGAFLEWLEGRELPGVAALARQPF